MPIYQYQCLNCNLQFDLKQDFNDESIAACPRCRKSARRVFSPVPIIFKGSGFYVTDNANSERQSEHGPELGKDDKAGEGKK